MEDNQGAKFDGEKLRMDLIPQEAICSLGEILTYGAKKYGPGNWEKGIDYNRLYAATMRHLMAWMSFEKLDEESGLRHIEHALCNLAMLVTYVRRGGHEFLIPWGMEYRMPPDFYGVPEGVPAPRLISVDPVDSSL